MTVNWPGTGADHSETKNLQFNFKEKRKMGKLIVAALLANFGYSCPVEPLTKANFHETVQASSPNGWFVKFYLPTCPHC